MTKQLTKEECLKAFEKLKGMILTSPFYLDGIDLNDLKVCETQLQEDFMDDVQVFSQLIDEHFELKEKYSKILDDVHDYRHEAHLCKMQIRNLMVHFGVTTMEELTSIYYNHPLKFEELEPDMWVWDNLVKGYMRIYGKEIKYNEELVEYCCGFINFEENRFYRKEVKHD